MFFDDGDREFFLSNLLHYGTKYSLQIADYCLMDNHTHLGVVPENEDSLWRALKGLHQRYSQYLNRKFRRTGVNWQGRFFSSPLDSAHSYAVFQYIAMNPVKAGMVRSPSEYRWSSAGAHLGLKRDELLTAGEHWLEMAKRSLQDLRSTEEEGMNIDPHVEIIWRLISRHTKRNLPIGKEKFIEALERRVARPLKFRPHGRPLREK
jgi:putative transposase